MASAGQHIAPTDGAARLFIRRRIDRVHTSIRRRVVSALPPHRKGNFARNSARPGICIVHQIADSVALSPREKADSMKTLWQRVFDDEDGLILSAELILIVTIGVLGIVVGLSSVQQAVIYEMQDISLAIQSLNQSFATPTYRGCMKWWGRTSWVSGSSFIDVFDGCVGAGAVGTTGGYSNSEIIGGACAYGSSPVVTGPVVVPQTGAVVTSPSVPCETCPQTISPTPGSSVPLTPQPIQH